MFFCATMSFKSVDELLTSFGAGRRSLDDPLFRDAHEFCNVFRRAGTSFTDARDFFQETTDEFRCNVAECDEIFHNLAEFEIHYNSVHRYACSECKITRPNNRLLEIHIQEVHDSFFRAASEKRPMYQCYNPDCDEKFVDSTEREIHCTTYHKFPENFLRDAREQNPTASMEIADDSCENENPASSGIFGVKVWRDSMEAD